MEAAISTTASEDVVAVEIEDRPRLIVDPAMGHWYSVPIWIWCGQQFEDHTRPRSHRLSSPCQISQVRSQALQNGNLDSLSWVVK